MSGRVLAVIDWRRASASFVRGYPAQSLPKLANEILRATPEVCDRLSRLVPNKPRDCRNHRRIGRCKVRVEFSGFGKVSTKCGAVRPEEFSRPIGGGGQDVSAISDRQPRLL